jgi:hypothetical protein
MTTTYRLSGRGRSLWSAPVLALAAGALVGCNSLLSVDNPNNIKIEDTANPVAAEKLVNGAERQVSFGVTGVYLVIGEISDELEWVGSRDAWLELDQGKVSNGYNEFTDVAMPGMASARWLADYAITTLEAQQAASTLADPAYLAEAYLVGGIAYTSIADWFDDFVFSDRDSAGTPIGHAAMQGLYDVADGYLSKGLALASGELALQIQAVRARERFAKAVWTKTAAGGMVNAADVAGAVSDANAVLAAVPAPDWTFDFTYGATVGQPDPGAWINSRHEMRLGPPFVARVSPNKWGATILMDPIDGVIDPYVDAAQNQFLTDNLYTRYVVTSAREMHLIVAEAALAAGNNAGFSTAINNVRAIDGLTAWTGTPSALAILQYERQASLFLTGRRLADQYRFGLPAANWNAGSQALTQPGRFLPITARECLSNPNIGAENCSGG